MAMKTSYFNSNKLFNVLNTFGCVCLMMSCQQRVSEWQLTNPDSTLQVVVKMGDDQSLTYGVTLKRNGSTHAVLSQSPLGFTDANGTPVALEFVKSEQQQINDKYTMKAGKQLDNEAVAEQLTLTFTTKEQQPLQIIWCAYADGIAFRYQWPDSTTGTLPLANELTGFRFANKGKAWIQEYDKVTKWTPAYEKYFQNGVAIGSASSTGNGWCFPALFESSGVWVLPTEADMQRNNYGTHLEVGDSLLYKIVPPVAAEANSRQDDPLQTPWLSPWRVIIVSDQLADVVESNLVHDVSSPAQQDFSWVKPGRASWSWWSESGSAKSKERQEKFIDLAAAMGWE